MDSKDASSNHAQTVTRLGRLPKKLSGIPETAVNEFGMIFERMAQAFLLLSMMYWFILHPLVYKLVQNNLL